MTTVTIFGSGTMGTAIDGVLTRGGATVRHIGSSDTGATVEGDTVVLAVPYDALSTIVANFSDQLAGRTVVDVTNPLDFGTFDSLVVPAGSSATAELQKALPSSSVVKAFNTTFAATLSAGTVGGDPTTVLVAGDDTTAKSALISTIESGGLRAVDAGALSRAHELEAVGFLQLTLAAAGTIGWDGGFALIR